MLIRVVTSVSNEPDAPALPDAPTTLTLDAPYPNPSTGGARARYGLAEPGSVRVRLLDLLGREVAVLAEGDVAAGWHEARLPRSLASGTYVVEIRADSERRHRRVTIVR